MSWQREHDSPRAGTAGFPPVDPDVVVAKPAVNDLANAACGRPWWQASAQVPGTHDSVTARARCVRRRWGGCGGASARAPANSADGGDDDARRRRRGPRRTAPTARSRTAPRRRVAAEHELLGAGGAPAAVRPTSAGGSAKRWASVALAIAPKTATPTALPRLRQNRLVAGDHPAALPVDHRLHGDDGRRRARGRGRRRSRSTRRRPQAPSEVAEQRAPAPRRGRR